MFTFWHCPNYFYIRGSYPRAAGLLVNKQFFLGELYWRAVHSIRRRRRYQHHIKVYEPRRRKRGTHQTAQSHTQNFLYINLNVFISTLYNAWIKVQRSAFVLFSYDNLPLLFWNNPLSTEQARRCTNLKLQPTQHLSSVVPPSTNLVLYGVFCLWEYKIHHKIPLTAS